MKKLTMFLSLATAAVILSGCYISPCPPYPAGYGTQCPSSVKVKKAKKNMGCKPVCKPTCKTVYKPTCTY